MTLGCCRNNWTGSDELNKSTRVDRREHDWAEWMRASNAGDAAAYHRLLRDMAAVLRPRIRGALARGGRDGSDAEDVLQEILIAVHLKRHTWDDTRPIGPWMRAIVQHKVVDALRRRDRHVEICIDDVFDTLSAEAAEPALPDRDVHRHLEKLPERQRLVLRALAIEGASIAEAAKRLDMSEVAVRVAFHRGLRALSAASKP